MSISYGFSYSNIYIFSHIRKTSNGVFTVGEDTYSQLYALDTQLLASIYQAMSKYIYDKPYHRVGGAFWFVQM